MPPVVTGVPVANRYGDLSVTVPAGADYLLCGIGFGHGGVPTVGTATFNGDTAAFIAEANDTNFQIGSAFGRVAPDIVTGLLVGGPSGVTARAAMAFAGVDPTTPVAANTPVIGLSTAPAATVSVPTDGLAVALVVFRGTGTTVTAGTDETVRVQYTEDSWGIAWVTKAGTGSVSFAPVLSQSTNWNIVALALNGAAAPPGPDPWPPSTTFLRTPYRSPRRPLTSLRGQVAQAVWDASFFGVVPPPAVAPLYIGADGESVIRLGTRAASALYLGPRTLF
jgi:hypothetical protein